MNNSLGPVFMADQVFMYATTAAVMIGLAVLLFVVRGRRSKGVKATISGHEDDKSIGLLWCNQYIVTD
jgi:hypothetical protein